MSSLAQLHEHLLALESADTPVRLLRQTAKTLSTIGGGPVSAFGYSPTGTCDPLDEQTLPPELRGTIAYPELQKSDHKLTQPPKKWAAAPSVVATAKKLGHGAPQLRLLEAQDEILGGVVLWHQ